MNFSFFLFSAMISSISSARVMSAGYTMSTKGHAYNDCRGLIELENRGYELPESVQIFLYRCSYKFGLERSSVDFRTMMFMRRNPGKVYEYIA